MGQKALSYLPKGYQALAWVCLLLHKEKHLFCRFWKPELETSDLPLWLWGPSIYLPDGKLGLSLSPAGLYQSTDKPLLLVYHGAYTRWGLTKHK
jgi:hypothetical protein